MKTYRRAMSLALSNGRIYHLAAILRRNGRVIRIGVNSDKTHPRFVREYNDGTSAANMHAEMDALRFSEPGDELEVMRFRKSDNKYAIAKPCSFCMKHIKSAGIKKVTYTDENGEWVEMFL
jgi:deoxycytidylate deaminase